VETAVEGMMAAAENSEIKLHTDCLVDDLRVRGNAVFLERAVSNLLSNAIKYGGRQSQVRIRVSADRLQACVEVRDQGPGIPAEAIPHIFDKFYRVKSAATASIPGSGLGLAYVREVAQQHGGSVAVESSSGAGSAFTLRIPLWGRE
jgi:signal transduction histidine kinase